jgi:hypothetical protein
MTARRRPPMVPDRMTLVGSEWHNPGEPTIEPWGDHRERDGEIRFIGDGGEIIAGTFTKGGTDDLDLVWSSTATAAYPPEWLDKIRRRIDIRLAYAWGAI